MSFTLVTGGAKNLGKEICLTLARNQCNVAIHYNTSKDEALEIAKECISLGVKAEAIQGNFSSMENVKEFVKEYLRRFPKTNNLINNVGNYLIKSACDTEVEEMIDLFQVNLYAPFFLIQSLIPLILEEKGSIINIGVAGINQIRSENYSTAYSLTKMNLLMLTKSLAKELSPFGVTVNMVSPGILEGSIDAFENRSYIPMKRFGNFSEVADVVAFLLKPNNHYITGQNIEVAGGVRL